MRKQADDTTGEIAEPTRGPNPLSFSNFRLLWLNNVGFFIVANAQRFLIGWLVLDGLNRGEQDQGLAVFALGLPAILLVLQAGVWADRMDRRLLLIGSQAAGLAVMAVAGILVATDALTFGWLLAVSVAAGAASAIGQPVRASLIPALVPKETLLGAIAVNALAITMSMILGPVVVERVGEAFGFKGAFWFQAILLAVGLMFLFPMTVPPSTMTGPRRSVSTETRTAVSHIVQDRALRTLFVLLTVSGFTINPAVMVTLQAFVKDELGRDGSDAAPLFALMGVGLAISSLFVMRRGNMGGKGAKFQFAMMVGTTMTVLMGQTTAYWQLLPLVLVMGLAGGFYINMNQSLIQANTPQELMGRVMGVFTLVQAGFLPLGALNLGFWAERFGTGTVISAAAGAAFVIVATTYLTNPDLRQLD